ncbi:MAG: hypothetical protein ACOVOW_01185 [Spirosomataceae bacterium]
MAHLKPEKAICHHSENAQRIAVLWDDYIQPIDAVLTFLQGKSPTLAR